MTVRIGNIELTSVQNLHTLESRTLVEQRVPEQQGSVFQDLGREPVTLILEGLLLGENALSMLEKLRQAHAKAEPLSFAADIAVGSELTEVVIEDFKARQVAGYDNRLRFSLRLREHIEPPQPAGAATAGVDAGVADDAAAWGDDSLAAANVLQDPSSLTAALGDNPGLLDQLDMDDLGSAIADNMDALNADQLGGMLESVADLNPAKASALMDALGKAGALGDMINKFVAEGKSIVEFIRKIPVTSIIAALKGGLEFLTQLKKVADAAGKLVTDIGHLELPPELDRIIKGGGK